MTRNPLQLIAIVSLLLGSLQQRSALGHHSFVANYLMEEEISIEATVTSLRVANPHSVIIVQVTGASGETEEWVIEMGTPTMLRTAGWTSSTLPAGTKITAVGNPTRSGAPTLALIKIVLADGTELLAPGR